MLRLQTDSDEDERRKRMMLLGWCNLLKGVGNFDLIFLSHFFPKSRCAHLCSFERKFPEFSNTHPTFVSSALARGLLWAFKRKSPFVW